MTIAGVTVRAASQEDVAQINLIYNRFIVDSHVSFDTEPWTHDKRSAWLTERTSAGYPVLVATTAGSVVGAAWSGPWRDKSAYARSAEATIAVVDGYQRRGIGSMLHQRLMHDLANRGFHRCYAIVALPNDSSVAFHRNFGFTDVGVLDEVGHKDGTYVSTLLLEKQLDNP